MIEDRQLLDRYVNEGSETAFAELVGRHVNLVYATALRRMNGDAQLAQDVAQLVFTDLARKARGLPTNIVLGGWLHRAAGYAAAQMMRAERRRQVREQEAATMTILESAPGPDWEQLRPLLDAALDHLNATDHDALVLRFFEQRNLAEVGRALGANEEAARKRVGRALERLRAYLMRRGIVTTSAALSAAISVNAVPVAPPGLAASLTATALAGSAASTGITLTALKLMSLTKLQLCVTAIVLAGAATVIMMQHEDQNGLRVENATLRKQVEQLRTDNQHLAGLADRAKHLAALNLPAPRLPASMRSSSIDEDSTDLLARMQRGEKAPLLTPEQAESYLAANKRSAESLLAAFRATGDTNLLQEAKEKYPNIPQVAFTAACLGGASPEERRHWLDLFKQSAPNNALPDYLSALEHFKAGETDAAVQDITAATGKRAFQDYSWDFIQNEEEAYRAAGYPETQARIIPNMSLLLPHLGELKQLNENLVQLAGAYRQSGDTASAQAALQMDLSLGQQMHGMEGTGTPLITQLVGMSIENIALRQMDPNSPYGTSGQTVQERLDELTQQRATLNQFGHQLDEIYTTISAQDWINYHDRWQTFGEENAMKWLLNKYGKQ